MGAWHVYKPLPEGVSVEGALFAVADDSLQFLADVTAQDDSGNRVQQQRIHAATLEMVRNARDFLLLDYFLFNAQGGPAGALVYRDGLAPVSGELIEALRELRLAQPELPVLVITDPINDYYRGTAPAPLAALQALGVDVVVTGLDELRDSNPVYSGAWRWFGWWMPTQGEGRLPNVLDGDGPRLRLGALLRLPNFKANHRKLLITGDGAGSLTGIVASANPHDASSAHSNVALRLAGETLRPLLESELAIARRAGLEKTRLAAFQPPTLQGPEVDAALDAGATRAGVITEGAIRDALLARFGSTRAGDAIDVAQFYLADRAVLRALRDAARRGVSVRLLLDPNRDAFGFEKSGVPNRPLANALLRSEPAVRLRWYRTDGEQFHAKLALVRSGDQLWFTLGSANFTRRNLGDYNLEANVQVEAGASAPVSVQVRDWFDRLWSNADGMACTDAAERWQEDSRLRYWQARLMEATGLSTF